jgi:hypothetical protein
VAGEIESGVLELVLAQPPAALPTSAPISPALAALAFVLAAGGLGTTIGQRLFAVHAFGANLLPAADLFLLQPRPSRSRCRVGVQGLAVAVIGVVRRGVLLINVIATFWPAAFLEPGRYAAITIPVASVRSGQRHRARYSQR